MRNRLATFNPSRARYERDEADILASRMKIRPAISHTERVTAPTNQAGINDLVRGFNRYSIEPEDWENNDRFLQLQRDHCQMAQLSMEQVIASCLEQNIPIPTAVPSSQPPSGDVPNVPEDLREAMRVAQHFAVLDVLRARATNPDLGNAMVTNADGITIYVVDRHIDPVTILIKLHETVGFLYHTLDEDALDADVADQPPRLFISGKGPPERSQNYEMYGEECRLSGVDFYDRTEAVVSAVVSANPSASGPIEASSAIVFLAHGRGLNQKPEHSRNEDSSSRTKPKPFYLNRSAKSVRTHSRHARIKSTHKKWYRTTDLFKEIVSCLWPISDDVVSSMVTDLQLPVDNTLIVRGAQILALVDYFQTGPAESDINKIPHLRDVLAASSASTEEETSAGSGKPSAQHATNRSTDSVRWHGDKSRQARRHFADILVTTGILAKKSPFASELLQRTTICEATKLMVIVDILLCACAKTSIQGILFAEDPIQALTDLLNETLDADALIDGSTNVAAQLELANSEPFKVEQFVGRGVLSTLGVEMVMNLYGLMMCDGSKRATFDAHSFLLSNCTKVCREGGKVPVVPPHLIAALNHQIDCGELSVKTNIYSNLDIWATYLACDGSDEALRLAGLNSYVGAGKGNTVQQLAGQGTPERTVLSVLGMTFGEQYVLARKEVKRGAILANAKESAKRRQSNNDGSTAAAGYAPGMPTKPKSRKKKKPKKVSM